MGIIADRIRQAIYGKDVRDSIADGIAEVEQLRADYDQQVINAGSSNAEIVAARGGEVSLPVKINKIDSSLSDKANQVDVESSLSTKRELYQPIMLDDLSTEVKATMTGGSVAVVGLNVIGTENIKNNVVTVDKSDFINHGKNYFNKINVVDGHIKTYLTGNDVIDILQFYSEINGIAPLTNYSVNVSYVHVCFYNNTTFISGVLVDSTEITRHFTTPANTNKIILSTKLTNKNLLQLELGSTSSVYESYKLIIDKIEVPTTKLSGFISPSNIDKGTITAHKTTFLKSGKNKLNVDNSTNGYYYAYNTGIKVVAETYQYSEPIEVNSETQYYFNINFSHVCFFKDGIYQSGVVLSDTLHDFTTPVGCNTVIISYSKAQKTVAQLELGSIGTIYEPYQMLIDYMQVPPDMRELEPYPYYSNSYIYNKKLYCNASGKPTTALYVGADSLVTPKGMKAKVRFSKGNTTGTIALISNPTGLTLVRDITTKSLHIVFTQTNVNIGIFNGAGLVNLMTYYYTTPCKSDGITEYTISWNVTGDTISVLCPDGTTQTFTDSRIPLVMGRYCTFEYYWTTAMATRPIYSYFEITGANDVVILSDNFNRVDGEIGVATTGQTYTQFHI